MLRKHGTKSREKLQKGSSRTERNEPVRYGAPGWDSDVQQYL